MTKKIFALFSLVAAIGLTAFAAITGVYPKQAGPYYYAGSAFDSASIGLVGGAVKIYNVASADTEKIGNIVYISGKNFVSHSATITNYNAVAGVVVGGASTNMRASTSVADTSTIAALPGKQVIVLERGRAWVLADTQAGFSPGIQVLASIKSGMGGRLNQRATTIDTFFRIIGKTVDTTISGKAVLVDVRVR